MPRMPKPTFVSEQGPIPILNGAVAFRFMDSEGLPLEFVLRKGPIDWPTFITAAKASGNYTRERLERLIREALLILWAGRSHGPIFEANLIGWLDDTYGPPLSP